MGTVTIEDVAREAKVSRTSVSYILRDDPRYKYRPKTVQLVKETAARLGYQPNTAARLLRESSRKMVGLAVTIDLQPPMNRFAAAVHKELLKQSYQPLLFELHRTAISNTEMPFPSPTLLAGIISADLMLEDETPEYYSSLLDRLPIVALYPVQHPRVHVVTTDRHQLLDMAVRHLVELGHTRITYLGTSIPQCYSDQLKWEGWQRAVEKYGVTDHPVGISRSDSQPRNSIAEVAQEIAAQLVAMAQPPTALICLTDDLALSITGHLARLGWQVPKDISIVAYERSECASLGCPLLTTLIHNFDDIAQRAVKTLITSSREEEIPTEGTLQLVTPILMDRGSTAPPSR